jgi:hypothetical protein
VRCDEGLAIYVERMAAGVHARTLVLRASV